MSRSRRTSRRPSPQAIERLRDSLQVELGELSVRFEEAQLRSDALRRLGRRDDAVDALEESRDLLRTYQARVERALSAAAVEREAEWVMADAERSVRLAHTDGDDVVIDLDAVRARRDDSGNRLRRLPASLSAVAASVLVIGMAVATMRAPGRSEGPTTLAAAGDVLDAGSPGAQSEPSVGPRFTSKPLPYGYSSQQEVLDAIGADDPVIDMLLTRRRDLLSRLSSTVTAAPSLLEELQQITGQLAAEGLNEELLEWLDSLEAQQPPAEAPQAEEPQPEEPQPAAEEPDDSGADAQPSDPESDPSEEDDGGVFGELGEDEDPDSGDDGAGAEGSSDDDAKGEEDGSILG